MSYRRETTEMVRPFPDSFIKSKGGKAYVEHSVVRQRIIQIFGVPPKIEILRELYDDTPEGKVLTGIVMRLTVPGFEPVEDGGEADNPMSKTNGARFKDACSDGIKRCAMGLGIGLHLWAQENFYVFDEIQKFGESKEELPTPAAEPKVEGSVSEPSTSPPAQDAASAPPAAAPEQLPSWLRALQKSYSDEAILQTVNAIRAERPKAADRVPLDSIEEVAKARQATQEEIGKRLAETDWSVPQQQEMSA